MCANIPEGVAAIYSRDPVGLWYQSPGFPLTKEQVTALVALLNNPDSGTAFSGGDKRFIKLQSESGVVVHGKSGSYAAAAAFSNKAVLICFGKAIPQAVGMSVQYVASHLRSENL